MVLLFSTLCFAQDKVSDEEFLNSVYSTSVDTSLKYYYLFEEKTKLYIHRYDIKEVKAEFSKFAPAAIVNEMLQNAIVDTLSEKWNCQNLEDTKCIDQESNDSLIKSPYFIDIDSKWSKRRQKKEEEKQLEKQQLERRNRPKEERGVYYISRPIFNQENNLAIISIWYSCGWTCGDGCVYLFKYKNGTWIKLAEADCKMS